MNSNLYWSLTFVAWSFLSILETPVCKRACVYERKDVRGKRKGEKEERMVERSRRRKKKRKGLKNVLKTRRKRFFIKIKQKKISKKQILKKEALTLIVKRLQRKLAAAKVRYKMNWRPHFVPRLWIRLRRNFHCRLG